jgi:ATP-dependent DNA helicase RecG
LIDGEIGERKRLVAKFVLSERESKLIEFKSVVPKFATLIKTCIAFANAAGGRIIIGVDDDTHEVLGVNDKDRARIYDDFPNSLYDTASPSLIAQIYEQSFGDKSVLIIEVPMSPRKPYFIKKQGVSNGTYIRVGSSTRKATPEYIEDLTREAQRIHYDEELLPVSADVLSKELLKDFYSSRVSQKRLLADKIIAPKPANNDHYSPTVAGVLMFAENPQDYIPEALIKCTRFKGISGRDIIQTEDITGSIEQQAQSALKIIDLWLATDYTLQGAKLKGKIPVPKDALREAVLNALLHRKYTIPGAIKIALYNDRLEVFSPGCFPGLVDINNLGDGTTYLRNPTLVRLAYQMNLIETRGTGIRLIYESCKKMGIRQPIYHEDGDFVKLVFFFEPDRDNFASQEDAIIELIKMSGEVIAQQVADYLSISRNTAIRKLNILIKNKKVKKIGGGSTVKYKLT